MQTSSRILLTCMIFIVLIIQVGNLVADNTVGVGVVEGDHCGPRNATFVRNDTGSTVCKEGVVDIDSFLCDVGILTEDPSFLSAQDSVVVIDDVGCPVDINTDIIFTQGCDKSKSDFEEEGRPVCVNGENRPCLVKDWKQCIRNNQNIQQFLIKKGDYTDWGVLDLTCPYYDDTSGKKRVIRAFRDYDIHPSLLDRSDQVIVEKIEIASTSNWIVSGLTVESHPPGQTSLHIRSGSSNNIIDRFLVYSTLSKGIQISKSSNNCIQNSIVKNPGTGRRQDMIGILIVPRECQSNLFETHRNRIVGNEVINMSIGIGIKHSYPNCIIPCIKCLPGLVPERGVNGSIISFNDIYVTNEYIEHVYAENGNWCIENAMDIKMGSTDENDPIIIRNNNIWGYRNVGFGCSGSGEAINIQLFSSDFVIQDNIAMDQSIGIRVESWKHRFCGAVRNTNRDLLIENNIFSRILDDPEIVTDGAAFVSATNEMFQGNYVSNATEAIRENGGSAVTHSNNIYVDVNNTPDSTSYECRDGMHRPSLSHYCIDYVFERKRLTEKEEVNLHNVIIRKKFFDGFNL